MEVIKLKKFALALSVLLCLLGVNSLYVSTASAEEKQRNDYTFGEIEKTLIDYLDENGYNLEVGTPEFNDFVTEQMNTDKDEKLANREDYQLICAYFAEYLYRLSVFEADSTDTEDNTEDLPADEDFNMDEFENTTLGEMKEEIEEEEQKNQEENSQIFTTMSTNTLNLSNARAYAKKYYANYNPNYPRYSNDCTNFVSQILQAGGRRQVVKQTTASLVSDNKYWFIRSLPSYKWSRSASWTVVPDLYSHLTRTQGAYSSTSKSNIIKNAKSGDVIQFKKSGADRYTHSMWIYEKTSTDLKLAGHTNNYWNRGFNAVTGYKTYRIVKM